MPLGNANRQSFFLLWCLAKVLQNFPFPKKNETPSGLVAVLTVFRYWQYDFLLPLSACWDHPVVARLVRFDRLDSASDSYSGWAGS